MNANLYFKKFPRGSIVGNGKDNTAYKGPTLEYKVLLLDSLHPANIYTRAELR